MNDLVSTISVDPIIFLEGETTKCISLSDERKLFGPAGTQNWEFHNTSGQYRYCQTEPDHVKSIEV